MWPWLVQLGQNRGGFYTYDWLENLFRLDIHSADGIHPEWQDPRQGEDYVTLDPDGTMKMTFAAVYPGRAFVLRSGAPGEPPQEPGSFFRGETRVDVGFLPGAARRRDHAPPHPHSRRLGRHHGLTLARRVLLDPMHLLMEEACCAGSATAPTGFERLSRS